MNPNSFKDTVSNAKSAAEGAVENAADKMAQMGRKARDSAVGAMENAQDISQTAADNLKQQAAEAAAAAENRLDNLTDAAQSGFRSAKSSLADGGDRLAKALHDAAEGTRATSDRVVEAVSTSVSNVADHLRTDSISDLVASSKAYAQRHPATVAAGAAVLGFVVAHLVQSQARNRDRRG